MTFYERYETLCTERGMKPQTQEILDILGVTSPTISGWKKGSSPKMEAVCCLARYFGVTTDYLMGLSELRTPRYGIDRGRTSAAQHLSQFQHPGTLPYYSGLYE